MDPQHCWKPTTNNQIRIKNFKRDLDPPGQEEHGRAGPDGRHIKGLQVVDDVTQNIQALHAKATLIGRFRYTSHSHWSAEN